MKKDINQERICCICGKTYNVYAGIGHNPWPLMNMGENLERQCCEKCNRDIVLPIRKVYDGTRKFDEFLKMCVELINESKPS